jgi:LPS export ABC transporter protein LptC
MNYRIKLQRLAIIILIAGGIYVAGCYGGWWDLIGQAPDLPSQPPQPNVPGISIRGSSLIGWDDHQKAWEIKAEKIWQTSDSNLVYFETITEGVIFSVKGERVTFTAGWARWEKHRSELTIGKGLTANFKDGTFTTPEAVMNYQTQVISSEKGIRYVGDEVTVTAAKLRANVDQEELHLEGQVVLLQDGDEIHSRALTYYSKQKRFEVHEPEGITLNL